MKRVLRLVLLLGVAISVSLVSSPKPADATAFCNGRQGATCTAPPTRAYSCFWLSGPDPFDPYPPVDPDLILTPGTCFCNQGLWDCA